MQRHAITQKTKTEPIDPEFRAVIFDYGGVLSRHLRLQPEVLNFARELRSRGIKTAVLSNMPTPLTWFVKKRGYFNEFGPVIISSDVGYSKPDPEIYKILIRKLGLKPDECVFIDNKFKYLLPAQELGMGVILAKDSHQTIKDIRNLLRQE